MAYLFKRGKRYYAKYYVNGKQKEQALRTDSFQIAKERLRQLDSGLARGDDSPLPTRTPLPVVLGKYVEHIRAVKTPKSAQNDIYYLREAFGACCEALTITSRTQSAQARKKSSRARRADRRRRKLPVIEAKCFEAVTTAQISEFIAFKVRDQGVAPKTANHYRSILRRLYNWATNDLGLRLPDNINPAARVQPYRERAPEIRYLTLTQIEEQLHALRFKPQLQTMVAVLIYAGLRREELLWLTVDDVKLARSSGGVIRVRAKTVAGERWQPKTRTNRAVPISSALRPYLKKYTVRPTPGKWFFPSPSVSAETPCDAEQTPASGGSPTNAERASSGGGGRWDADNFSADLREANWEHGLSWSCLDFRHTFGSQLAQKGVSLYKISELMGNSPEICRRHYAALAPEAMVEAVEFASAATEGEAAHAS